jgi:hypothetical protein
MTAAVSGGSPSDYSPMGSLCSSDGVLSASTGNEFAGDTGGIQAYSRFRGWGPIITKKRHVSDPRRYALSAPTHTPATHISRSAFSFPTLPLGHGLVRCMWERALAMGSLIVSSFLLNLPGTLAVFRHVVCVSGLTSDCIGRVRPSRALAEA